MDPQRGAAPRRIVDASMSYPFIYALADDSPSDEVADQEEAQELIDAGVIDDETMVWTEGMDSWLAWLACKGTFGFAGQDADGDGVADGYEEEEYTSFYTELMYHPLPPS